MKALMLMASKWSQESLKKVLTFIATAITEVFGINFRKFLPYRPNPHTYSVLATYLLSI